MNIAQKALQIRQTILKTACFGGAAHIAPALSMADIISVLYFNDVLRYDAKNPDWDGREFSFKVL